MQKKINGIEIKKDTFADDTLSKLKNLAAVIVIPDLLTPGINDNTWKRPIIKTSL